MFMIILRTVYMPHVLVGIKEIKKKKKTVYKLSEVFTVTIIFRAKQKIYLLSGFLVALPVRACRFFH